MILKVINRLALTAALFALFTYMVVQSFGFEVQARLFPLIIGLGGAALTGIQLIRDLRQTFLKELAPKAPAANDPGGNSDFSITESELTREGRLRAVEQFVWIGGLLVGVWLLGYYVALPLAVALYTLREREPLKIVIPLVAGVALTIWGVFDQFINLPFPKGIVFNALGF